MKNKKLPFVIVILVFLLALTEIVLGTTMLIKAANSTTTTEGNIITIFGVAFAQGIAKALIIVVSYICFILATIHFIASILLLIDTLKHYPSKSKIDIFTLLIGIFSFVFALYFFIQKIIILGILLSISFILATLYLFFKRKMAKIIS